MCLARCDSQEERAQADVCLVRVGLADGEGVGARDCQQVRRLQDLGSRIQGSGFEGFRVQGLGFRVQGSGFRVQGLGSRIQGAGFRDQSCRAQDLGIRVVGTRI